jgi:hypothetical protein
MHSRFAKGRGVLQNPRGQSTANDAASTDSAKTLTARRARRAQRFSACAAAIQIRPRSPTKRCWLALAHLEKS